MERIKHYMVLIIMFFSFINIAHASVVINEVRINPTGERFIELYNSGEEENLTDWVIKRKTASGTEYTLVSASRFKDKNISAGGYFVLTNEYDYTGSITPDATWAKSYSFANDNTIYLYNNNGNLVSKVGWGDASDCDGNCPPNPGDDSSIQRKLGGGWIVAIPTPKDQTSENNTDNQEVQNNTDNSNNDTTVQTSSSGSSKEAEIVYKITTKIIAPKIVTAGVPFIFDHQTSGVKKEKVIIGKFVWNFGDGMSKSSTTSDPFEYIYNYPGEYVVTLSYGDSTFDTKPDATDRITIKVVSSGVGISSVGTHSDPFVELENKSGYEMSISKWILKGSTHSFVIPEGMIILPNKKLKLSPKITGFDFSDLNSISIIDTSGQIFASYPNNTRTPIKYSSNKNSDGNIVKSDIVKNNQIYDEKNIINLNDLAANAGGGENVISNKVLIYLGLAGILILGILSIILIRRKAEYPDYVEKELSAKDMTIIE